MNLQENGIKLDTHRGASQRVLVLQGGGSLGAYEAGVYKTLYQNINEQIDKDDNVFDIIAGTSIGAINAALLVNHILESRKKGKSRNESWEGSDEMLEHFWKEDTSTTMWKIPTMKIGGNMVIFFPQPLVRLLEDTIQSNSHWQQEQKMYISHCLQKWILNSLTPLNTWHHYSNDPLGSIIKKYWDYDNFPIKTSYRDGQPRLLLVTVDIQKGVVVTFDIYAKTVKDNKNNVAYQWKTEYDDEEGLTIKYDKGINIEHLMASASFPIYYDYTIIDAEKSVGTKNDDNIKMVKRYFWDGQLLSNTPLRELIGEHKKYWESELDPKKLESEVLTGEIHGQKVPDLEVYIANLWPTEERDIPQDHDLAIDRMNDLLYHDKTKYDEKVAEFVTDYIDLAKRLIKLAKEKGASDDEIKGILNSYGESKL